MNETIKTIKERRSIRSYKDKAVSKEILEELVDCGRLAPSARNNQLWEFIIVTEKETLTKLSETISTGPFIGDAAACIIVCGDSSNHHLIEDGSAATENILVAAHSLGLGACWVAGVNRTYDGDVKNILEIPEGIDMVSIIPIGYPSEEATMGSKRDLKEVIHWDKY